jgi:type IV pilus assembly protein PilA
MAANEAAAVGAVRTVNTAEITYLSSYPDVGYANDLPSLGGADPCTPSSASSCLIDSVLTAGVKSGYNFGATGAGGPPNIQYYVTAWPVTLNGTGTMSFCSYEDAVVRADPTGAQAGSEAACQALGPLYN